MTKRITVFGGSTPEPGEPAYEEAVHLGKLLGDAEYSVITGYTVLTGGYAGTMEATSRGANEAGAHVIGVTCDEIENFRPKPPNPWVKEKLHFASLRDRMYALIDECDAAIALPGGIGTLSEIAAMWSTLQTAGQAPRPLILVGPVWKQVFDLFISSSPGYVREQHIGLLQFAESVEEAFQILEEFFSQ